MSFSTFTQSKTTHRAGSLNPKLVQGELPLPVFTVDSDNGALYFHDNGAGGQFIRISNVSVAYRPPNRTQIVKVTADDGHHVDKTLTVTATFPLYPQKQYEIEGDQETKVKTTRDGTQYFAEIGKPQITWRLGADRRIRDEIIELWNFCMFHGRVKQCYVYDEERGIMNLTRRISPIPTKFESSNSWDGSVIMKGDYAPAFVAKGGYTIIRVDAGGSGSADYASDRYFANGILWSYEGLSINEGGLSPSPGYNVLKSARYDPSVVTYNITGLVPSSSYTVKLYFVSIGSVRGMQISFNGVAHHTVSVGSSSTAVQDTDTATSDSSGKLTIAITRTSGANAMISAISIEKI